MLYTCTSCVRHVRQWRHQKFFFMGASRGQNAFLRGQQSRKTKQNKTKKKPEFSIQWKILRKAKPYCNVTKRCNLCIMEKYFIICKPKMAMLIKRSELTDTCSHTAKFKLKTIPAKHKMQNAMSSFQSRVNHSR